MHISFFEGEIETKKLIKVIVKNSSPKTKISSKILNLLENKINQLLEIGLSLKMVNQIINGEFDINIHYETFKSWHRRKQNKQPKSQQPQQRQKTAIEPKEEPAKTELPQKPEQKLKEPETQNKAKTDDIDNNKESNDYLSSREAFIAYIKEHYKPDPINAIFPTILDDDLGKLKLDINGNLYLLNNDGKILKYSKDGADRMWSFLYFAAKEGDLPGI